MHISITLNPKHESFMVTAFLESLATSGHTVKLVYDSYDLIDKDAEPSLENLGVQNYMLRLVDSVIYNDGDIKRALYEKSRFLTK